MADVTYTPMVAGTTMVADTVMQRVYDPDSPATSLAEKNGLVTNANRDPSWDIGWRQIRSRSCARGDMVGVTTPMELFPEMFPEAQGDDAFIPIVGATWFVPRTTATVEISWMCVLSNAIGEAFHTSGGQVHPFVVQLYVNGVAQGESARTIRGAGPTVAVAGARGARRRLYRDRIYSGHTTELGPAAPTRMMSADLRVFFSGRSMIGGFYPAAGLFTEPLSARVRTRYLSWWMDF